MRRRRASMIRKVSSAFAVLVIASGLTVLGSGAAAAASSTCLNSGPDEAFWSPAAGYTYSPGTWCMQAHDAADPGNHVVWQGDGNLVWYINYHALWATGTNGKGATRLVFQTDGNIVIYAGSKALWASGQSTNANSATNFYFTTGLYSNQPNFEYELSAFQLNPTATHLDLYKIYNG